MALSLLECYICSCAFALYLFVNVIRVRLARSAVSGKQLSQLLRSRPARLVSRQRTR